MGKSGIHCRVLGQNYSADPEIYISPCKIFLVVCGQMRLKWDFLEGAPNVTSC